MRTMMARHIGILFLGLILPTALPSRALGQAPDYITNSNLRGVVPFGSYQFGDIDNVNLGTGTLNVKIPIIQKKSRGGDSELNWYYSSKNWEVTAIRDPNTNAVIGAAWSPTNYLSGVSEPANPLEGHLEFHTEEYPCTSPSLTERVAYNFVYVTPDGGQYRFPNRDYWKTGSGLNCPGSLVDPNRYTIGQSDSGGMELDTTTSTYILRFKDGSTQTFVNRFWFGDIKDTNGNYLNWVPGTGSTSVDNAGRQYRILRTTTAFNTYTDNFAQLNTSGTPVDSGYSFSITPISSIATQFLPTSLPEQQIFNWSGQLTVLSSITCPNNKSFTFQYDSSYGEITHIGLPTGGSIDYTYVTKEKFDNGPDWWLEQLDSRRVATRTVSDGLGHSYTWSYDYAVEGDGFKTTVIDPMGNKTIHYFDYTGMHEVTVEKYQGSSTVKKRVENQWTSNLGPAMFSGPNDSIPMLLNRDYRIYATTTKLLDVIPNLWSRVETDYDTYNYTFITTTYTGTYMNSVATREYDFGQNAVGALLCLSGKAA